VVEKSTNWKSERLRADNDHGKDRGSEKIATRTKKKVVDRHAKINIKVPGCWYKIVFFMQLCDFVGELHIAAHFLLQTVGEATKTARESLFKHLQRARNIDGACSYSLQVENPL